MLVHKSVPWRLSDKIEQENHPDRGNQIPSSVNSEIKIARHTHMLTSSPANRKKQRDIRLDRILTEQN